MIDRDKVVILAKALKASQRNHHWQSQQFDETSQHAGQHWQHCPAMSCTAAFIALKQVGVFKQKDVDTRMRIQTAMMAKYNVVLDHDEDLPEGVYDAQVTHVDKTGIHMKVVN